MRQVLFSAGEVVIHYQDIITLFEELLSEMGSQESSAAGDEDFVHLYSFIEGNI